MKSDLSRHIFDQSKHFSSVQMQQGRVQVDADWNEQSDIATHRVETEALDVIGPCGAPQHYPAFHIVDAISKLSAEEQALDGNQSLPAAFAAPDFLISAGRYYVDGILCENEKLTSYKNQPDLPRLISPALPPVISSTGLYLIYVDVWERLITALDDPSIREIALGGPDTTTRKKTVWQVKHWFAGTGAGNCNTQFPLFEELIAPSDGKLSVRSKRPETNTNPCEVSPGAGYTGLENQFYRIEIHEGGQALNVTGGNIEMTKASRVAKRTDQVKAGGDWAEHSTVEIFSGDDQTSGKLAYVSKVDAPSGRGKKTLTLGADVSKLTHEDLRIRGVGATYKWSRDNGVVVTTIESIIGPEITVHDLGPDDALGFKEGQWVEIIDDGLELNGLPGQLAQIIKVDAAVNLITLDVVATPLDATQLSGVNRDRHPKLLRWDGVGAVVFHPNLAEDHFLDLENGVQIRFFAGSYKTGDYWTAAARTATADTQSGTIEWPLDTGNQPLAQLPFGIKHHYCRLAMLHWRHEGVGAGGGFDVIQDCRNLFPPLTELTSLFYVSGDGQEVMPELTKPSLFLPLPQQLIVGVANGELPMKNAEVRFHVELGNGKTLPGSPPGTNRQEADFKTLNVLTDDHGLARCTWQLDSTTQSQQVRASLQAVTDLTDDSSDKPTHIPIIFTANLSVATEVAYNPGDCASLEKATTVQKALDRLSHLISLYEVKGNNQEVVPGEALLPLVVMVANRCGAVLDQGVHVLFKVISGGGKVNGQDQVNVVTDATGQASCVWIPGNTMSNQEVEASLVSDAIHTPAEPTKVRFISTLSVASHVYYDSSKCEGLKGQNVTTVQDAIDHLCEVHQGGSCDVTVGIGGLYPRLDVAIKTLLEQKLEDICICLLPGDHELRDGLMIEASRVHVKIVGCGRGSRMLFPEAGSQFLAVGLASLTVRDVEIFGQNYAVTIDRCEDITFAGCYLTQENQEVPFITVGRAQRIRFDGNVVSATLPLIMNPFPPKDILAAAPSIADLFTLTDRSEFDRRSLELSSELVGQTASQRTALAKKMSTTVTRTKGLTTGESQSYLALLQSLGAEAVDAKLIRANLADIRFAVQRATPGVAIVLNDGDAETRIEDNGITGIVSLYGVPGSVGLTEADIRTVAVVIKSGKLVIASPTASLHIRNNEMYRMNVSGEVINLLKSAGGNEQVRIQHAYRRCFITNNMFSGGQSVFVMEHLALTANTFDDARESAGSVVASAAIYTSNYASSDAVTLFSAAIQHAEIGNLLINIMQF